MFQENAQEFRVIFQNEKTASKSPTTVGNSGADSSAASPF